MSFETAFKKFPIFETDNLILRDMRQEDASDMFNYFSNKEVSKYLDSYGPKSIEEASEAIRFFRDRFDHWSNVRWAIIPKAVGRIVGSFAYNYFDNFLSEIAYEVSADFWNQGIMTEVFKTVIPYGFDELELHRIQATVCPQNIGSMKVLKKFGFQEEGLLRDFLYHRDEKIRQDVIMFSLLNKDYVLEKDLFA
jgi:Acetyltransferases, including N-acetylases of ribosomal proteins